MKITFDTPERHVPKFPCLYSYYVNGYIRFIMLVNYENNGMLYGTIVYASTSCMYAVGSQQRFAKSDGDFKPFTGAITLEND